MGEGFLHKVEEALEAAVPMGPTQGMEELARVAEVEGLKPGEEPEAGDDDA